LLGIEEGGALSPWQEEDSKEGNPNENSKTKSEQSTIIPRA